MPLRPADDVLLKEMEQTAFSSELADVAERDGQQEQLEALQHFWRNEVAPALKQAQEPQAVTDKIATYVNRIDTLVTAFDHSTEQRMARVVILHRVMAILLGLLLLFTVVWLRARLLQPWEQLLKMAQAVSQRNFTRRAQISGRNEMATLGTALNNMSEELAESYAVLEQRVQEKTAGLEQKTQILSFLWQANHRLHSRIPLCERLSPVLHGLQNLTLLHDIELRVTTWKMRKPQEFTCHSDITCDDRGAIYVRAASCLLPLAAVPP